KDDSWTNVDSVSLLGNPFGALTADWSRHCGLRMDLARRQALLELDVLVALFYEISLKELLDIYRIQFPVMRQYERETYFDQKGRIVFTVSKGLPGVGVDRSIWDEIKD